MTQLIECDECTEVAVGGSSEASGALPRYEIVGPRGAPVVVALGGISAGAHATSAGGDGTPGWWEEVVGPGRAVDTGRFRVLSFDWLDEPGDGVHEAPTTADQADALARVLDAEGVERARLVIGASYGGMVALTFGARHGARAEGLVAISAAHESHPFTTGLRAIQRRIVRLGLECGRERDGLALARALGMTTYRSALEFADRFSPNTPEAGPDGITFAAERYLLHQGGKISSHFDARRFLALSLSTDLHRVDPREIRVPTLLVAADGDTLVPREQIEELVRRIGAPCLFAHIQTRVGHDAFLAEPEKISRILAHALARGVVA